MVTCNIFLTRSDLSTLPCLHPIEHSKKTHIHNDFEGFQFPQNNKKNKNQLHFMNFYT
jgi:hypothetical protein